MLFTNGPELFDHTYVRYLTKSLRDAFPFSEVAIKVVLRAKGEGAARKPEADETVVGLPDENDASAEIFRGPQEHQALPPPAPEEETEQRPKKKPRGSETWDF